MLKAVFPYIGDIIYLFVAIALSMLSLYLKERWGAEKIARIKEKVSTLEKLAEIAVLFVQQVAKEAKAEEKFELALIAFTKAAQDRGIEVDEEEMRVLIESTLKRLKKEFGEAWKNL